MNRILNAGNPKVQKLMRALKITFVVCLVVTTVVSAYLSFTRSEQVLALPSVQLDEKTAPATACIEGIEYLVEGSLPQGAMMTAQGDPKACSGGAGLDQFGTRHRLACFEGVTLVKFYAPRTDSLFVLFDKDSLKPRSCTE